LVTTREAVRQGFLQQALSKAQRAKPYIATAIRLSEFLADKDQIPPWETLGDTEIQDAFIAASGFSDKARSQLDPQVVISSVMKVLQTIQTQSPQSWRDEMVYRYLLTRGDTLGGIMRNLIGTDGNRLLTDSIVTALERQGKVASIVVSPASKIVSLSWGSRRIIYDKTPRVIGKNVDVILLDTSLVLPAKEKHLENPTCYIACGEIKGGIDPAGSDEHWKTANSAFERIRSVFASQERMPNLFFAGAAIEQSVAEEIFHQLETAKLSYVANLTSPEQVHDLAQWLTDL
jgi:type II restriction enzyme